MQMFTKDGKWVKDFHVAANTPARGEGCGGIWNMTNPPCGTVYNLALSRDPAQKYVFAADGTNNRVWILALNDGRTRGSFGGTATALELVMVASAVVAIVGFFVWFFGFSGSAPFPLNISY